MKSASSFSLLPAQYIGVVNVRQGQSTAPTPAFAGVWSVSSFLGSLMLRFSATGSTYLKNRRRGIWVPPPHPFHRNCTLFFYKPFFYRLMNLPIHWEHQGCKPSSSVSMRKVPHTGRWSLTAKDAAASSFLKRVSSKCSIPLSPVYSVT